MKSKIWLALLALYLVWGSTYLGIKFAVETIPPFIQGASRFLVSGLILVIWQWAAGTPLPNRKQWRAAFIIGTLLLLGGNGLVSWAEQFIPSGIAALIIGTVPLFLVIGEALRPGGVKPSWQAIVGLLIGFVGIFILVGPAELSDSGTRLNPLGLAALFGACITWTLGSIYSKSADMTKSSLMNTGAQMLAGSVSILLVSILSGELRGWSITNVSAHSFNAWVYLIFAGSLIGFASFGWLLQNAPISLVATYAYVNPIVAVFLGSWLGQEPMEPRTWLAAMIIVGSVVFISQKKKVNVENEPEEVLVESQQ